jgi:hypothetical protein
VCMIASVLLLVHVFTIVLGVAFIAFERENR